MFVLKYSGVAKSHKLSGRDPAKTKFLKGTLMAKKKPKRRKPKPRPEPQASKDSGPMDRKGKTARLNHDNQNWFPTSEPVENSKKFAKIKGRLTRTKRASRGG